MAWLRLIRSRRVGATTFYRLLSEHGSAQAALDHLPEVARNAGEKKYTPYPETLAIQELAQGRASGARLEAVGAVSYPPALAQITDPPPLLWIRGDAALTRRPMVALVGARNASSLGTRMARRLGGELGEAGFVVVSGLARGIDTAAHLAALPHGTAAVLAGGVDVIYPAENAALADDIAKSGLLISEQPPGLQPQARHFPRRNRIISGMAQAVLVVEAAAKSGSLITARDALDQGREVLAVPGHPFDARASGCNMLIRDGATLIRGVDDVIELLQPATAPVQQDMFDQPPALPAETPPERPRALAETAQLHRQILDRLGPSPLAEDQLIRDLALPAQSVTPQLLTLELEGRIQRQPGGLLARVN
uniref:DNA-processing protein DprA n=1 Tax=Actibacterium mucosum TaxID=1087332 RepID=UPI00068F91A1|nr:DNA-processing protein DprA [Actibacterium mucosum]